MSDVSVDLGLNAAKFDSDLARSLGGLQVWGDKAGAGLDRVTGSGENLLRSSHRVSAQIYHLSRALSSGADGSDVFAIGLEGLARSLNISLGALAGLGIAAAVGAQFYKVTEQAKKLRDEINQLANDSGGTHDFETLDKLEARLAEIKKKADELGKSRDSFFGKANTFFNGAPTEEMQALKFAREGTGRGIVDKLFDQAHLAEITDKFDQEREKAEQEFRDKRGKLAGENLTPVDFGEALRAIDLEKQAKLAAINATESAARRQVELETQILSIQVTGGDVSMKIADARIAAAQKELELAQAGTVEAEKKQAALEKELAARVDIARKARESLQESLEDIAKRAAPRLVKGSDWRNRSDEYFLQNGNPNAMTATAWWEGMQAREALRLKELGKQEQNTYGGEAGIAARASRESQALAIEGQIGSLKDNDKDLSGAVRAGFDASTRLGDLIDAVRKISFGSTN